MTIHGEHPFVPDPADRDPVRRLRGRLASPVTIITSGDAELRSGLTVSSISILEGEPGRLHAVVGPTSDLWDQIAATGRFVVHICRAGDHALADTFAGLRPSPGGVFAGTETVLSDWGPVLVELENRVFCSLVTAEEVGYSGLVVGEIDRVEATDLVEPLVYFRGRYRSLE